MTFNRWTLSEEWSVWPAKPISSCPIVSQPPSILNPPPFPHAYPISGLSVRGLARDISFEEMEFRLAEEGRRMTSETIMHISIYTPLNIRGVTMILPALGPWCPNWGILCTTQLKLSSSEEDWLEYTVIPRSEVISSEEVWLGYILIHWSEVFSSEEDWLGYTFIPRS